MSIKYQSETGIRFLYSKAGQAPLPSPKPPRPRAPKLNSAVLTSKPSAAHAQKFRSAFSPNEVRHNFIIQSLPKPSWYKSRPYLYTCARCKWTFRVNDSSGSIIPLNENGEVLPEPNRSRRIETFAQGPCGVFPAFTVEGRAQARRSG
jgi:hypothetical protein